MQTAPRMSKAHFDFLADTFGAVVPWPTHLKSVADELEKTNPRFDREKFLRRANAKWDETHELPELDDEIPY